MTKVLAADTRTVRLLKLIASATRFRILRTLHNVDGHGRLTVQDLASLLGMTHSAISHQLAALSAAGIVTAKQNGRWQMYALTNTPAAALVRAVLKTVRV